MNPPKLISIKPVNHYPSSTPKSLSSWNESLPFCIWVGITCRLGRVSSLELTSASLSGEIPPQLGELTHLRTLKLGLNSLTGNLPPEIGNLTSLITLDLSGNGLEGKLPVEIGKLTRLKFLDLNSKLGESVESSGEKQRMRKTEEFER
ncbi:Leucine-rich repeat protein 2 [Linum perenne]